MGELPAMERVYTGGDMCEIFLVAIITCHDQKQLMEERVYLGLSFQRDNS